MVVVKVPKHCSTLAMLQNHHDFFAFLEPVIKFHDVWMIQLRVQNYLVFNIEFIVVAYLRKINLQR